MAGPEGRSPPNGRRNPPSRPPRYPRSEPPNARLNGGRSGLSRRCIALKDALPLEKGPGCIRGLGALRQPVNDLLFVDLHCCRVGKRVVVADLLDEPAISWRACIGHHQAVEGAPFGSHPPQPDLYQSMGTSCTLAKEAAQARVDPATTPAPARPPKTELPGKLLHLLAGLEHPVHVGDLRPAAGSNPAPPRPVDAVATSALLRRHRQDNGFHLLDLRLGILIRQLALELTAPRHHLDHACDGPHASKLADLDEEVVEREVPSAEVALHLLGLLAIDGPLSFLDQAQHIAHPEDARGHPVGVEYLEIGRLLPHAGKANCLRSGVLQ